MDLNWFQSILYGFFSGLMEILPLSSQAHTVLLMKFFGIKGETPLLSLLVDFGIFAALYISVQSQLIRLGRARTLARTPKSKRRRPLDTRSLMDLSLLKTMLLPVILGLLLYQYTLTWQSNLMLIASFLFINGLVLYIPQFLPSGNRDSRTLSRVEGLLMGLGGAMSILPGISSVGAATSIASVCGVDRSYSLSMTFLMELFLVGGFLFYDAMDIAASGMGILSFGILIRYLLTALCAFGGTLLSIKLMRQLAQNQGYGFLGLYCFGLSLLTFIINLMA